jgi:hypothetical protein
MLLLLKDVFTGASAVFAVLAFACLFFGCGGAGDDGGHALVIDTGWVGVCVSRKGSDAPSGPDWGALVRANEICAAYEGVYDHGRLNVTVEQDPNRPYYDRRNPKYPLKGQDELVFRLAAPDGPMPWQEVAVDTVACVRFNAYLRPGVSREEADLRRRLVNFQSLQRIVQGLEEGEIQKYRQVMNARRYVLALRNLAANSVADDLARAYSTYADAIDARIAVGVMERGFFFQADRRAFFAALPTMTAAQQELIGTRIASESLEQLKQEPYPGLTIRFAEVMSRIRAMSFSNEPKAERQRLLAEYYANAAELLHKIIVPTSIEPGAAARMLQLLEECLDNFVAVMPPKAEGDLKYYEARVGYEFVSPECAQQLQKTAISVMLVSEDADSVLTIPLKLVSGGQESQLAA